MRSSYRAWTTLSWPNSCEWAQRVLYFKARWPDARLIAVEPHPGVFQRLVANTQHLPGVELVHAAVTGTAGPVTLFAGNHSWASILRPGHDREHRYDVRGVALDGLAEERAVGHVDLLKIDIEGAEGDVLLDSRLMEQVDQVIFEFHHQESGLSLWDILAKLPRFEIVRIQGDTNDKAKVELAACG